MRHAELVRFSLVGIGNTCIGLLCIWAVMVVFDANYVLANLIGYVIGLGVSFCLNSTWTFRYKARSDGAFFRWLLLCAIAYLVNIVLVTILVQNNYLGEYLAQPAGIAAYTSVMYMGSKYYVFRQGKPLPGSVA